MDVVSPEAISKANHILEVLSSHRDFGSTGRRNDDMVDMCIACHILNINPYTQVLDMLHNVEPDNLCREIKQEKCFDHIDRIHSYLITWGPRGNKELALDYLVRSYW